MNSLTKSLSKAYATDGILVNTVSPAFIMTPLVADMLQKIAKEQGASPQAVEAQSLATNRPHIELKRPGRSEEVASAVGLSDFGTGVVYYLDEAARGRRISR